MAAKPKDDGLTKNARIGKRTMRRTAAFDVELGQRVRVERLKRQISQQDVAEQLGISFQQVQKYEKGTNRISAARLIELAGLFQISVSDLLAGHEKTPRSGDASIDVNSFITSTRAIRLLKAFSTIEDSAVQNLIIDLTERLAHRQKP